MFQACDTSLFNTSLCTKKKEKKMKKRRTCQSAIEEEIGKPLPPPLSKNIQRKSLTSSSSVGPLPQGCQQLLPKKRKKKKQKKTVFQRKADDIKKTRTCERLRPRCDNTIGQNTALTVVPFRITVSSRSKLVART